MPLIQSAPDALPYVDAQPSAEALQAANAEVLSELSTSSTDKLHPAIPAQREGKFSDFVAAEHARIAAGAPKNGGLDLSRYELQDPPAKGDLPAWKSSLTKAYASAEYLRGREINLSLLETYGKNAWLIGNSQMEETLRDLEKELEAAKLEREQIEQERRRVQATAAGEMQSLDEGWRTGVGRMIEAQAASERLKYEVLERKRHGAS